MSKSFQDMIDSGFEFYKAEETKENTFIQIPKQFYACQMYKKYLTPTTRELYGWLRDRMSLSEDTTKKGSTKYVDEFGYIYFVFTRQKVGEVLGLSKQTVSNAFDTLNKLGLIYEKRLGQGKTNRIYIGKVKYMSLEESNKMIEIIEKQGLFLKSKNSTSEEKSRSIKNRLLKNRPQEVESLDCTNTNITNTNILLEEVEDTSSYTNLIKLFEDNICNLKKTTKEQFLIYCDEYNIDFIKAIISLCAEINTESFAGFKVILTGYISKGIITRESLETYVTEYREESKKIREKERKKRKDRVNKADIAVNSKKESTFNNFEQRPYDGKDGGLTLKDIEKKAMGWE